MTLAYDNAFIGKNIQASGTVQSILIGSDNNISLSTPNSSGLLSVKHSIATSGNISATNMYVNNIPVSTSGHLHKISDIQNLQPSLDLLSGSAPTTSLTTNTLFLWANFQ